MNYEVKEFCNQILQNHLIILNDFDKLNELLELYKIELLDYINLIKLYNLLILELKFNQLVYLIELDFLKKSIYYKIEK